MIYVIATLQYSNSPGGALKFFKYILFFVLAVPVINTTAETRKASLEAFDHGFVIEPELCSAAYSVESEYFGRVNGSFENFNGEVKSSRDGSEKPKKSVDISLNTNSVTSNVAGAASILQSEAFFDSDNYPHIVFKSDEFFWTGDKDAVLIGKLTIKNKTASVKFQVTKKFDPVIGRDSLVATTNISRSKFGMNTAKWLIGDRVTLHFHLRVIGNPNIIVAGY